MAYTQLVHVVQSTACPVRFLHTRFVYVFFSLSFLLTEIPATSFPLLRAFLFELTYFLILLFRSQLLLHYHYTATAAAAATVTTTILILQQLLLLLMLQFPSSLSENFYFFWPTGNCKLKRFQTGERSQTGTRQNTLRKPLLWQNILRQILYNDPPLL